MNGERVFLTGASGRIGRRVERIEREGADWRALAADGSVIAEAPTLVIGRDLVSERGPPRVA